MGLKGNKKQSNQEETAADIAIDAHIHNTSSIEQDDPGSDRTQNHLSSVSEGKRGEEMDVDDTEDASVPTDGDRDSSSVHYQHDYYASQDQYSQSETESNINGKDEEHLAMQEDRDTEHYLGDDADDTKDHHMDNEKESQEDEDESKSEISRSRRTRSSSIDEQYQSKNIMEDTGSSVALRSKKDGADDTLTDNKSSRSAAAAERELLGFREPPSAVVPTTSFLDSLSEEQRRVRTRHLPDIAGFRRLHKSEIKRDMALVKKLLKGSSSSTSKNGKKSSSGDDEGTKDTDAEKMDWEGNGASEDESQSDFESNHSFKSKTGNGRPSDAEIVSSIIENPNLPNIFSIPFAPSPYICTDVEATMASDTQPYLFSSPHVVESIAAFNPPRPPESVGPKKMHRLNRWERNPQDIDVDLSNYKKTVERTRQELHKAEEERKRIEVIGQHLRTHCLSQLQCMSHEMELLNDHYEITQAKCIKAADLLTSKTRNRGVARGSNVIKDVLSVLKARTDYTKEPISGESSAGDENTSVGIGGISHAGFSGLASGWLLPGDKVSSPYGDGVVVQSFGATLFESSSTLKNLSHLPESNEMDKCIIVPPRICVKLPFGIGYFRPEALKLRQSVKVMNDDQLAKRWTSMIDSAKSIGSTIDSRGVETYEATKYAVVSPASSVGNDGVTSDVIEPMICDTSNYDTMSKTVKLLQYGSSLLPTPANRGAGLDIMSIEQLENNLSEMLDKSAGVLGSRNNPNVPRDYKQWEKDREELRNLQGKAMQLRNAVYRQRRIRFMNEKNNTFSQNRRDRFEALLSEMKSDLDLLKERLKEELFELGIDQAKARKILSEYYQSGNTGPESNGVKRKAEADENKSSRRRNNERSHSTQ